MRTALHTSPLKSDDWSQEILSSSLPFEPGRPTSVSTLIHWPKGRLRKDLLPADLQWTSAYLYTCVDSDSNAVGPLQSDPASVATSVAQSPVEGVILAKDTFCLQAIKAMSYILASALSSNLMRRQLLVRDVLADAQER